jgi:hypothetical protein
LKRPVLTALIISIAIIGVTSIIMNVGNGLLVGIISALLALGIRLIDTEGKKTS